MKIRRIIFIVIFLFVFVGSFVFYANKAFLYSGIPTHYNLTQEIIKFYNLAYDPDITLNQAGLILKGSLDEDTLPRPAFHLYDPVYNRAPFGVYTAKEWAINSDIQSSAIHKFANLFLNLFGKSEFKQHGDYSWTASINSYTQGNSDQAFYGLGHILHLIEDMSVPAHSRNDHHIMGDPYEQWAGQNTKVEDYNWAEKLYNQGYRPREFYLIEDYFNELAKYSNKYFFSKDTILSDDYPWPRVIEEKEEDFGKYLQRTYAMGRDENGNLFRLAYKDVTKTDWLKRLYSGIEGEENIYSLDEYDIKTHSDYWTRLAPKAVMYGAGVIKLFLEQTAENQPISQKAQVLPSSPEILPKSEPVAVHLPPSQPLEVPLIKEVKKEGPIASPEVIEQEENQGEDKGISKGEEQEENKGIESFSFSGSPTVSSPSPQEEGHESQDTTSPDVSLGPLIYNYASSSLTIQWSSLEYPSISFTVEYKEDENEWQTLLENTAEIQTTFICDIKDTTYYFRVRAKDLAENWSEWQQTSIEIFSSPVVINEIAWMGTKGDFHDEWIELYNKADYDIDLTNWILESDDSSPEIVFNNIISAKGYYLIERISEGDESDDATSILADWYGSFSYGLKDSGEILELRDNKDILIDSVDNWYAGNSGEKRTMERISPKLKGTDSNNWKTYIGFGSDALDVGGNPILGTPKAQNSVYDANPPSRVSDLSIFYFHSTFLILQWTAPVDEEASSSLIYDIRYADKDITESNWSSANQSSNIPSVDSPGILQTIVISGLTYNTDYYFALRTSDGANISEISNVINYSVGSPPALSNSPWPTFQRNIGHTGFVPYQGPDFIASSSVNVKWTLSIENGISAPQVIGSDNTIYLGDNFGKIYAIDYRNGRIKWSYDTFNYKLNWGGISSSPSLASDGTIYFSAYGGSYFYALTPEGYLKWKYQIGGPNDNASSSVISSDGTIYFTANHYLYALNPDGTLKWEYFLNEALGASAPALGPDGTIFVSWGGSNLRGYLIAIDPEGNFKWTTENINSLAREVITIDSNGIIYLGSLIGIDGGFLMAINPTDGSIIWQTFLGSLTTSPAIGPGGNIYITRETGILYALDAEGVLIWDRNIGGWIRTSPIIDSNEVIYLGAESDKLYALNHDGSLKWDYELDDKVCTSPIMGQDGTIYVASCKGTLYALGR